VSNPATGFDWGDAGIGAGTVFAIILLGAGALLATQHVGHPARV
jgi:DMSO reductase anchor subunit